MTLPAHFNRILGTLAALGVVAIFGVVAMGLVGEGRADPQSWKYEWPKTDFSRHSVPFAEIMSGGPPKDGIPPIDDPKHASIADAAELVQDQEPVVSVVIDGAFVAYPLSVLMWHEIVNDKIGDTPISVTFCPLCNSAVVFDRRFKGRVLDFGTTGKLRNSDLVMWDRQTESWWQQFLGEGIVGEFTGARLTMLPSRLESFAKYKARAPQGKVLVPRNTSVRAYGTNPYAGYDGSSWPFLYRGDMPKGVAPLSRVVSVGNEAWSLDLLRRKRKLDKDDLVITWEPGQTSALDSSIIADGRDIGNVLVQRRTAKGLEDVVYDVSFAFAFVAFRPKGVLHISDATDCAGKRVC